MFKKLVIGALFATSTIASASVSDFFDNTYLLDLKQGSLLSERAYGLRQGGYETSTGEQVTFTKWYKTKWVDTHVMYMTKVHSNFAVLWGFSTGEKAEKYEIKPSYKLGAVYLHNVTKTSTLTFRGTYTFGGELKEKSCTADYGDIGGVQQVNCRLAATELAPADTLKYMLNERPRDWKTMSVTYTWNF